MKMFTQFVVVAAILLVANVKPARADTLQQQINAQMTHITATAYRSNDDLTRQIGYAFQFNQAAAPFTVLPQLLYQAIWLNGCAKDEITSAILQQGRSIFFITRAQQLLDAGDQVNAQAALQDSVMTIISADMLLDNAESEMTMAMADFIQWLNPNGTPPAGPGPMMP